MRTPRRFLVVAAFTFLSWIITVPVASAASDSGTVFAFAPTLSDKFKTEGPTADFYFIAGTGKWYSEQ